MKKDWTYKKLGEVCKGEASNIALNKISDNIGEYPLYGASGLAKHIDFYKQDVEYIGIVKDGAGVGRVGLYPAKSSLVGTMQYIIPSSEVKLRYLFYVLKGLNLANLVSGATIPHIYFKDYSKITIPVPPISIQESIVRELDAIHGILEKKQEQLRELDNLAQAIFYEMFGDPITNPKQWEVKKLGEVGDTTSGGTPSKTHNEYYENGTIPWLRSGEVSQGLIYQTELFITQEGLENSSAKIVPKNTVAIAMYGATVGEVGIIMNPMCTNQAICNILPSAYFTPTYLRFFLMAMKPKYIAVAAGGAQPNISQAVIRNTILPLPPLSLQQSFAAKIEAIEAQKQAVQQSIREIEALLAERMDNYFN